MKLILPNKEVRFLDEKMPLEKRKEVVDEILLEWNDYFESSWGLRGTQICLDVLANYICLVKDGEDKNKEDKFIMSKTKLRIWRKVAKKQLTLLTFLKKVNYLLGYQTPKKKVWNNK